jgi:hypothetical protein
MSRHTGSPRHRLDGPHIAVVQQDDAAGLGVTVTEIILMVSDTGFGTAR